MAHHTHVIPLIVPVLDSLQHVFVFLAQLPTLISYSSCTEQDYIHRRLIKLT